MKNWLKENWFRIGWLAIFIITIAGSFYWYSYRPNQIKKECQEMVEGMKNGETGSEEFIPGQIAIKYSQEIADEFYENCLRKNGF